MSQQSKARSKALRRRLLGVTYLAFVLAMVALSIASYNKVFTERVDVTLKTDSTGNQLIKGSDVKIRGLIVGEVREIKADINGATLKLGLNPSKVALIPSNVTVQLLPKTLFGERYVALIPPEDAERPIKTGDTIAQDRSKASLELAEVLNNLLPLLQAVRPAELNATLNALATALQGRGTQLGENLVALDSYLKQLNPSVPQLVDDLDKLGKLALELNGVAPELFSMLDNLSVTSQTVVEKQTGLHALLLAATSTSDVLTSFLTDNHDRIIRVSAQSAQMVGLLEEYSSTYGCFYHQMAKVNRRANEMITKQGLHLTVEIITQRGGYIAGDTFKPIPKRFGPSCWGLPNPVVNFPAPEIEDGAAQIGGQGSGSMQLVDRSGLQQMGVGSTAESALINTLISTSLDVLPPLVPDVATLLAGPLYRGNEVNAR